MAVSKESGSFALENGTAIYSNADYNPQKD
jgi:hypothetical protein